MLRCDADTFSYVFVRIYMRSRAIEEYTNARCSDTDSNVKYIRATEASLAYGLDARVQVACVL